MAYWPNPRGCTRAVRRLLVRRCTVDDVGANYLTDRLGNHAVDDVGSNYLTDRLGNHAVDDVGSNYLTDRLGNHAVADLRGDVAGYFDGFTASNE